MASSEDFWAGSWTLCGCGFRSECLLWCGAEHGEGKLCPGLPSIKVSEVEVWTR